MTLISKGPYSCGETPLWYDSDSTLYWTDAATHLIYSWNKETGKVVSYNTGLPVTAIRMNSKGQFILLSKWGLHIWKPGADNDKENPQGTTVQNRTFLDSEDSLRFNDGTPLENGDFIAGAFDERDLFNGRGALYRLNMDGKCEIIDENLHVPNGVAVSPDESTIYMSEMYKNRVLAYTGSSKRTVFEIPVNQGKPDGLLCDREGNLWVAHWRGSRLSCFSPEGRLLNTVKTPYYSPTCPCYGDKEQTSLYVTSATLELSDNDLAAYDYQGGVFKIEI